MKTLLVLLALGAAPSPWVVEGRPAFAAGRLEGLAIDPDGLLVLGGRVEEIARFDAKYAWDIAAAPDGSWIVGCGEPASVVRVAGSKRETIWEGTGAEVYAVHAARDGSIWWGVSPQGRVHRRTPRGETETYDLPDSYVWAFAETPEGIFVATGSGGGETGGAVHHLANGRSHEIVRIAEPHILSLVAQGSTLYGGTAGQGYLFTIAPDRSFRILHDPEADEIPSLAATAEGIYFLLPPAEKNVFAGAQSASLSLLVQLVVSGGADEEGNFGADSAATSTSTASAETSAVPRPLSAEAPPLRVAPSPSRRSFLLPPGMMPPGGLATPPRRTGGTPPGLPGGMPRPGGAAASAAAGGRIHLYRADGVVAPQYELDTPVREIVSTREGILFAEIDGGGVHRLEAPGRARLLARPEVEGILALGSSTNTEIVFVSKTSPTLFRLAGAAEEGTFRSSVFDAGASARWGVLDLSGRGHIASRVRTGMTADPGIGWSPWGAEIGIPFTSVDVPRGRFAQMEIRLRRLAASGAGPEVERVSVSFEALNHPPRVASVRVRPLLSFAAEGPQNLGKIGAVGAYLQQVLQGNNRPGRAQQAPPPPGLSPEDLLVPIRNFWVVAWEASDPDEDALTYRVVLLADENEPVGRTVAEGIEEPTAILNGQMLPEGRYRVRIEATDAGSRAPSAGETSVLVSLPFTIDNTPPAFETLSSRRDGAEVVVEGTVRDARGSVAGMQYSLDGGEWTSFAPTDGIADAPAEAFRLRLAIGPGAHLLLLRAEDDGGNIGLTRIPIAPIGR